MDIDEYREKRHEILYGMNVKEVSQEEAEEAIEIAKEFVEKVEDLLEGNR